jgi:uncharacterized protein
MSEMMSFILRTVEAAISAVPYLLAGILLAGIFRGLVGPQRLRKLLDGDRLSGPIRAFGFGLLLPVCSLGVLPIARELLLAGISRRAVFVFLMGAPLFHPLTIALALSVMDLTLFAFMLASSLAILLLAAQFVGERQEQGVAAATNSATPPNEFVNFANLPFGVKRMLGAFVVAGGHLKAPFLWELAVAFIGIGLVGALLDPAILGGAFSSDGPWAAPIACSLGTSIYVTPERSIGVLDQMIGHGNSLSAVLALLLCGVGLNLGTLLALRNLFGARSAVTGLAVLMLSLVFIGSLANATFYKPEISAIDDHAGHSETEGHTHAFDDFARPAALSSSRTPDQRGG